MICSYSSRMMYITRRVTFSMISPGRRKRRAGGGRKGSRRRMQTV